MADKTINTLDTELTTVGANDLIGVWDVAAAQYKKAKKSNVVGATITGGGTLALGGYTLTVPATGTAALAASGAWTPTITFGGASTGITYGTQGAFYVRIGPLLFLRGRIVLTAKGSATGSAAISGLPFTVGDTYGHGLRVNYFANMASIVDGIFTLMSSSVAVASLFMGNAATTVALTEANFTNTSRLDFAGVLEL